MSLSRNSHRCQGCRKYLTENPELELPEDEVKELRTCVGCQTSKYCSKNCQKKDRKEHKKYCEHIEKLALEIKAMEEDDIEDDIEEKCKKLNINGTGMINGHSLQEILCDRENNAKGELIDYIHKKLSLAYCIWHMADAYESYHLYEKFLEIIKEIMNKFHIMDLQGSLIMALLSMGRDDEAFALLKVGNDLDMFGKIRNWKSGEPYQYPESDTFSSWDKYANVDTTEQIKEKFDYICQCNSLSLVPLENLDVERDNLLFMHSPALVAIKLNNILELEERKRNFDHFCAALNIEAQDEGTLSEWKVKYPVVIDHMKKMILGFKKKKFDKVLADQYEQLYEFMELAKPFFNVYFTYEMADKELPPRYKLNPVSMYNFSFDNIDPETASMNRYWFYFRRLFGSEHHKNGWLGARKKLLKLYMEKLNYKPSSMYWSYSYYDDDASQECPFGCDLL